MDALVDEATRKLDDFNPQAIRNLAWAWVVLAYHGPRTHLLWLQAETRVTIELHGLCLKGNAQLYQYLLTCQHEGGGAALPPLGDEFTTIL